MKKLENNALFLLFCNGVIAIFGFTSFALLSNETPSEFFAQWVTFIAFSSFFEILRSGLIQAGFIKLLVSEETNQNYPRQEVESTIFLLGLFFSFTVALLFFLVSFISMPSNLILVAKAFPSFYLLSFPRSFLLWFFQGKRNYFNYFFVQFLTFGLFCFYLFIFLPDYNWALELYILLHFFCSIPFYFKHFNLKKWRISSKVMKDVLSFGKYTLGTQLAMNLLKNTSLIMIGLWGSATAVALYAIPLKLAELFDIILRSLSTHLYPYLIKKFQNKDLAGFIGYLYKFIGLSTFTFIAIALVMVLFSNSLLSWLGADNLQQAFTILMLFLISKILEPAIKLTGVGIEAMNRPKTNYYRYLFMLFLCLILNSSCFYWGLSLNYLVISNILVGCIGILFSFFTLKKYIGKLHWSSISKSRLTWKSLSYKRIIFSKSY